MMYGMDEMADLDDLEIRKIVLVPNDYQKDSAGLEPLP